MKKIERTNFADFAVAAASVCGTTPPKWFAGFYHYVEQCTCPNIYKNPNNGGTPAIDQTFNKFSDSIVREMARCYMIHCLEVSNKFEIK